MGNENVAISLCKNAQLYKLLHYRTLCESVQKEIDNMFLPLRQKVLRGYYLSKKVNEKLTSDNKTISRNINDNSEMVKDIQNIQQELDSLYSTLKDKLKENTNSSVDYESEEDASLSNIFNGSQTVADFLNIRSLKKNLLTQIEIPIALTQDYNTEMGYNNERMSSNIKGPQRAALQLSDCIKIQEIQTYLFEVIQRAIEIRIFFKNNNDEDYLKDHSIEDIKGVLSSAKS